MVAPASYVVRNMIAVANFFVTMANVLEVSQAAFNNTEQALAMTLNLSPVTTIQYFDLAYSVGPVFLANLSSLDSPVSLNSSVYRASTTFVQSLHHAPAVARTIWPLSAGRQIDSISNILQRGLSLIMSDLPSFLAFCSSGAFSATPPPSFSSTDAGHLNGAANVWMVSNLLQQNHWYAVPGNVSNVTAFQQQQNGCSALGTGGTVCPGNQDAPTYQSAITGRAYTLKWKGDGLQIYPAAQMVTQIEKLGLAITPVLFDGAYNCTFEGGAGNLLGIGKDGSVDTSCMSVLPMYLSKGSHCPLGATWVGRKCPFGSEG